MKNIIRKVFTVLAYALIVFSITSAVWVTLPDEIKNQVPQVNDWIAIISGVITLLLGGGGLTVQAFLQNSEKKSDVKINLLASNYLQVVDELKLLRKEKEQDRLEKELLRKSIGNITKLVEVDLETKLSNPLIEEKAKQIIQGVLNRGDDDEQES